MLSQSDWRERCHGRPGRRHVGPSGVGGDATSILTDGTNQGGGDLTVIAQATSGNGGQNVSGQFSGVKWGNGGEAATYQASGASSDGKYVTVEAIASGGGSSGEGIVSTC